MTDRALIDEARSDRGELERALAALGSTIRGATCTCPYHDDRNPSASIFEAAGGAWKVHCHVCAKSWDVWDLRGKAQGKESSDVLRDARNGQQIISHTTTSHAPSNGRTIESNHVTKATEKPAYATLSDCEKSMGQAREATYTYADPLTGHLDMVVFRLKKADGKKTFLQGHQSPRGIVLEAPPKPWPIYRRDLIANADRVAVVEGEKCADALNAIGIPATTSPGGAGKAQYADWSPLAGKRVDLWPDNDPPNKDGKRTGIEHMRDVARVLAGIRPGIAAHWLEVDGLGLPEKGDAADLLDGMDGQDEASCRLTVQGILDDATSLGASKAVGQLIEDTIAGKRIAAPFPWPLITTSTKALLPATVTLIGGAGGSTKSFLMMQCLAFWHESKISAEIYMLEDDQKYHLYRALAQRANNANVFDDDWIRENPEEARTVFIEHRKFLDELGPCIWDTNNDQLTLSQIADWVMARAKAGVRIICIDPITAASTEDKAWAEDLIFMMRIKKAASEYGASIILITHPKKGMGLNRGKPSMDDLAGGAAYQRFSHTIMMLEAQDCKDALCATTEDGRPAIRSLPVNRTVRIHKARNGRGTGMLLGMMFNGGTLKFKSQGIIQGKGSVASAGNETDGAEVKPHSSGRTRFDRIQNPEASDEPPF